MTRNRLKPHILKEMQLSFQLTEEREMASGRKRPGNPVPPLVTSKQKAVPRVSRPKKQKIDVESPQELKKEKPNVQKPKRPLPIEDIKSETYPSKKKAKKGDAFPQADWIAQSAKGKAGKTSKKKAKKDIESSPKDFKSKKAWITHSDNAKSAKSNNNTDNLRAKKQTVNSGKSKDSALKANKKQDIQVPKDGEQTAVKTKKLNNSKVTKVQIVKEKPKKVKDSKAQVPSVPILNGFAEHTSSYSSPEDSEEEMEVKMEKEDHFGSYSEDDMVEEESSGEEFNGFEGEDDDFFRVPIIFKVPKKDQGKGPRLPAPFEEPEKSTAHHLKGDFKGTVRKILVFESNALAEIDNEETDDEYVPRNSEDIESEDFDSEDSDSEDSDEFEYEVTDSDESEVTDSDDFGIDIFGSDDLDSTYEPPIIDGFLDDTPPHLQKEPLIIEEIFDEPPVAQKQKELVKYKPKEKEIVKEKIVEESIITNEAAEVTVAAEVTEEAEVIVAEESQTDNPITEQSQIPHTNDTPFYRNPQATPTELSVFENSPKSNYVLAVIKENMEFYGTLVLTLLSGQISVNGYKARRGEGLAIYSLKGLPWVSISPNKTKKPAKDEVDWEVLNEDFTLAQLDKIKGSFQRQTDAIVLFKRNYGAQRLTETFGKHMAQNVFPLLNASNRPYHQSESLLHCLIQNSDLSRTLQVPQVWNKLKIKASSRVMIAGGKGVGKSSLLRYLINRNLGQFPSLLLIDLDIGQPEVFVPQTVSCTVIDEPLLGPGFLRNKQPDHAYVVGHTNIVMCAEQYAKAVIQLIEDVRKDSQYAYIPWLVNTMGYNKGFGAELMALLVDRIRPTDLIQIASPIAINNFDSPLEWSSVTQTKPIIYAAEEFWVKETPKYTLHMLQSAVPPKERGTWSLSAKDMRYSNLLARLSECLTTNSKSLADCQTLGVPLDALKIQHPTSEDYTREELIHGMDANVVYLCHQEAAGLPQCLGIGVVRAIDYEIQRLFLVPAMPLQRMALVNCLLPGGELTLPQGYFRDQGQGVSSTVPFVFILDDSKSSKSIQQIYHRAPAFLGVPANQRNGN